MPVYPRTSVTAKRGVNFVRTVIEGGGSLFLKVDLESDLGVDAFVDLVLEGKPLNKQIAVQIKSGSSYYDAKKRECILPVGDHREYWARHSLPVYGIIYVPKLRRAHWVNIKSYLKAYPDQKQIRFRPSETNRLDARSFTRLFVPAVANKTPTLALREALRLARSSHLDELNLAILVLFRKYPNELVVWDELARCVRERPASEIPPHLVYYLAHIPGHGDIFYFGEQVGPATRDYAQKLISAFGKPEIAKLLSLVDAEDSISRGSVGQSVHAVVASIPDFSKVLQEIIADSGERDVVRDCAALILAIELGKDSISSLEQLAGCGSHLARQLIADLNQWGHISPY